MGESLMFQNLRRLINVVDELRDVGVQQYINLPRICVVGTQSAGKSSVLEAIVGMDFLPRGEGIVTRRPLELRLIHEPDGKPWASFEARMGVKLTDFEKVRQVIDELTEQVAGRNKGIVDDPIVLTVHSPRCPDLTLIDLPGITRVPLKGSDQTDDVERLTRDMALRYARDPRTIVLAVVPANTDMSTSDALQLARRVDPKGIRTIGVITKIDLMDRGTDAARMLCGDEVPLRLGYTGVLNRSQADINAKKTIEDALKSEKEFFSTHPIYRTLSPHMLGTNSLIEKLTRVLFRHIRTYLPEIKKEIGGRLRSVQLRLEELGSCAPSEPHEKVQLMWGMITDYCEIFRNTIRGKFDKKLQMYFEHQDITSGAQIRAVFNELLREYVDCEITAEMSDYDIDLAIRMHEGDSLPGFPSPDTFEYLILPHLKKIHSPVLDCLDRVTQCLEMLSETIANRVFGRFPKLSEQVLELSSVIIAREKGNTRQILENIVAAETGYLFTNDALYLTQHGSMLPMNAEQQLPLDKSGRPLSAEYPPQSPLPSGSTTAGTQGATPQQGLPPGAPQQSTGPGAASTLYNSFQNTVAGIWGGDDKKKTHYGLSFIKEIRERLDAYFRIVLRHIRDTVPKVIGCFLVRQLQDKLQFELYNNLNKADRLADLLGEPPHIMEEREALVNQMNVLKKAASVLQRDPSVTSLPFSEFDEMYDTDLAKLQNQATLGTGAPGVASIPAPQTGPYPSYPKHLPPTSHASSGAVVGRPGAPTGPPQAQPPSTTQASQQQSTFWGIKPGSSKKQGASLFGDRTARSDGSNLFSDKSNPLFS